MTLLHAAAIVACLLIIVGAISVVAYDLIVDPWL